jgi:hypothetical protein
MTSQVPTVGNGDAAGVEAMAAGASKLWAAMSEVERWVDAIDATGQKDMCSYRLQWYAGMEKEGAEAVGKNLDRFVKRMREATRALGALAKGYESNLTNFYIEPMREAAKNVTKNITNGIDVN